MWVDFWLPKLRFYTLVHNMLTRTKAHLPAYRNKEKTALKTGAPKHELETPQNRHITTVETYESASTLQICKRCNPTRTPNIQTAYPSADTENPCQAHVHLNTKAEITFCKHAPLKAGVSCILCFSKQPPISHTHISIRDKGIHHHISRQTHI